jgi:hypothetical protein
LAARFGVVIFDPAPLRRCDATFLGGFLSGILISSLWCEVNE